MNRAVLKTISYGVMHFTVAIAVAFALTQDWRIALSVGVIEPFVQTFAYTIHERIWKRTGGLDGAVDESVSQIDQHIHKHAGFV